MKPFSQHIVPPLALYVHFPWCVKKCPYCDFNSHTQTSDVDQHGYIEALLKDLDHDLEVYVGRDSDFRKLHSIFLGGGTPSLFSGAKIKHLLDEIRARIAFDDAIEITLEANPGAIEHDDFAAYLDAGVNRLSVGVQSFCDDSLEQLGRVHNSADAQKAIRAAMDAGFTNINIDLMYGLPQQTTTTALRDVEIAIQLAPNHLSLYQLTIEPNTWFHRYPPPLPDEQWIHEMQYYLFALASKHGYQQYEVSAYAKANMQCRHNLNYWQFGDYLGIGAGAHGKVTIPDTNTNHAEPAQIKRYWKQKHPRGYLTTAGSEQCIGSTKTVGDRDALFELLMNGLRLNNGFELALIPERTGQSADAVFTLLRDSIEQELVVVEENRIRCSEKGYRFLDEILQQILPE